MEDRTKLYFSILERLKTEGKTPDKFQTEDKAVLSALRDHNNFCDAEFYLEHMIELTELIYNVNFNPLEAYDFFVSFVIKATELLIKYHEDGVQEDFDSIPREEI